MSFVLPVCLGALYFQFTIPGMTQHITHIAVYDKGESDAVVSGLIIVPMQMSREHYRYVHLVQFGYDSIRKVFTSMPFL